MRTATLEIEAGSSFDTVLLLPGAELAEKTERFEATHLYAQTLLRDGVTPRLQIDFAFGGSRFVHVPMTPTDIGGDFTQWQAALPLPAYATGSVRALLARFGDNDVPVELDLTLVGRRVDQSAPAS